MLLPEQPNHKKNKNTPAFVAALALLAFFVWLVIIIASNVIKY